MITAWTPSDVLRSGSSAALWRVLGLGLLLFGFLYMHAASPEETVSHLAADGGASVSGARFAPAVEGGNVASATWAQSADEQSADHHDGHGRHHTHADCALGQPPQGPAVAVPCLSPLSSESGDGAAVARPVHARQSAAREAVAPITHSADSTVLRI